MLLHHTFMSNVFRCGLSSEEMENDFAALSCAQNLPPEKFSAISETCEQVLWRFKLNLTTSSMFLAQIDKACSRDTEKLNSCKNRYPGPDNAGHYMSCLIDEKLNGELKPACENFLTQVMIVENYNFNDFLFEETCRIEIKFFAKYVQCLTSSRTNFA